MLESPVEIDFKADTSDYRRMLFWYHRSRLGLIALFWLLLVVPAYIVVLFGAGGSVSGTESGLSVFALIVLLVLPLSLVINLYFGIWRHGRKLAAISEPGKVTFDEVGVSSISKSASSQMIWERFKKVYETNEDFIFFPQENVFYTIPKKLFISEAQIAELRSLLRNKLGKKAKLKE
ncbi:MAG TPA: YcxB family protein [Pyrinomonadaceae bacterium]|nr:YcxB family protein [Pyrinomonadaceae bacterium]